jgi:hypothetical protein
VLVILEVVEQSSASSKALYSTCQYLIHNSECSHGSILIVYHTMPCFITSYPMFVVRPDELSKDIGFVVLLGLP